MLCKSFKVSKTAEWSFAVTIEDIATEWACGCAESVVYA